MKEYKLSIGLRKGVVSILTFAGAMVVFAGLSDLKITDLIEQYLFPVLGSLSVGGAITMLINYVKVTTSDEL